MWEAENVAGGDGDAYESALEAAIAAADDPAQAQAFSEDLSDSLLGRIVKTPVEDVLLDREKVAHVTAKLEHHRERYANRILPTLTEPNEVWMTLYDNGEYRKRYIKVFEGTGSGGLRRVVDCHRGARRWDPLQLHSEGTRIKSQHVTARECCCTRRKGRDVEVRVYALGEASPTGISRAIGPRSSQPPPSQYSHLCPLTSISSTTIVRSSRR